MLRDLILMVIVGATVTLAASVFFLVLEERLRRLKSHRSLTLWAIGSGLLVIGGLGVFSAYFLEKVQFKFAQRLLHIPWPKPILIEVPLAALQLPLPSVIVHSIGVYCLIVVVKALRRSARPISAGSNLDTDKNLRVSDRIHLLELTIVSIGILLYKTFILSHIRVEVADAVVSRTKFGLLYIVLCITFLVLVTEPLVVGKYLTSPTGSPRFMRKIWVFNGVGLFLVSLASYV